MPDALAYLGTHHLTWLQRCHCQRSSFPTCTSRGWFFFRIIIFTRVSRTRTIIRMRSVESGKWPHHRLAISSQEEASSKSAAPEYSQILCNAKEKKASMKICKLRVLHECLLSMWDPDNPTNCISKLEMDLTGLLRTRLLDEMLLQS